MFNMFGNYVNLETLRDSVKSQIAHLHQVLEILEQAIDDKDALIKMAAQNAEYRAREVERLERLLPDASQGVPAPPFIDDDRFGHWVYAGDDLRRIE